jgi:hypothetical protein
MAVRLRDDSFPQSDKATVLMAVNESLKITNSSS